VRVSGLFMFFDLREEKIHNLYFVARDHFGDRRMILCCVETNCEGVNRTVNFQAILHRWSLRSFPLIFRDSNKHAVL